MITLTVAKSDARNNICSGRQHCADIYLVGGVTEAIFMVSNEGK